MLTLFPGVSKEQSVGLTISVKEMHSRRIGSHCFLMGIGVTARVLLKELIFRKGWECISSCLFSPVSMGTATSRSSLL